MFKKDQKTSMRFREEDEYRFLENSDDKQGKQFDNQASNISNETRKFFQSLKFKEFARKAETVYCNSVTSLSTIDELTPLLDFSYLNSEFFEKKDLNGIMNSMEVILPGNNIFWRVTVRYLLEISQTFSLNLQKSFLNEKKNGFRENLKLFNKVIIRDFLERYLGRIQKTSESNQSHKAATIMEEDSFLDNQTLHDYSRFYSDSISYFRLKFFSIYLLIVLCY